jgi:CcmD family protein
MDTTLATYLFYGFAAVWLLLAAYVLTLVARERRLRGEIDKLKRMIEKGGEK